MYRVTIENNNIETIINEVSTDKYAQRISGTVKQGINSIDSFSFTILPNNIGYNLIFPMKTIVKVFNTLTNNYEFIGRVLTPTENLDASGLVSKSFLCESELAYLHDSNQDYGEYHNISPQKYLKVILDKHNSIVDDSKKFTLGEVTVEDNNDSIFRYLSYDTSWKNINDLLNNLGGELQVRYEDETKYLDYLKEIGTTSETDIRLGKNIQSISREKDPTNFYTRIKVLGTKLKTIDEEGNEIDTEERLTIKSVNYGLDYIEDLEAIEMFGVIEGIIKFDDVNTPEILLRKGKEYLNSQKINISNKLTALDLATIGLDIDTFRVGNYHNLIVEIFDIDYLVRIIEKTIVIENPQKSSITLGDKEEDIKQYQINIKKQANKATEIEEKVNVQAFRISEASKAINTTSKSLEQVSSEVSNLGNSTNETINKMVESIHLLSETVININDNLISINDTLDTINTSITKINEDIISLDSRVKVLEGGEIIG